jgi:hypothetical protein
MVYTCTHKCFHSWQLNLRIPKSILMQYQVRTSICNIILTDNLIYFCHYNMTNTPIKHRQMVKVIFICHLCFMKAQICVKCHYVMLIKLLNFDTPINFCDTNVKRRSTCGDQMKRMSKSLNRYILIVRSQLFVKLHVEYMSRLAMPVFELRLKIQLLRGIRVPLNGLSLPHVCGSLRPGGPLCPSVYVMVVFVLSCVSWEVVVRFIDICRIVDNHCLKFL